MVTLYYIRRFINFSQSLFSRVDLNEIELSEELTDKFNALSKSFEKYSSSLNDERTNILRRQIVDELGKAGNDYRTRVYEGFSGKVSQLSIKELDTFFTTVWTCIDHTIEANKREDKLYHSYNLMEVDPDGGLTVRHLYEMLEGQVAVLSSGALSPSASLELLQELRQSQLYRSNQHSYILYPDRQLDRFENKNIISSEAIQNNPILSSMVTNNDRRIIERDVSGKFHFNGSFHNKTDVLEALQKTELNLNQSDQENILQIFEDVFDHKSFTGRSGTFFAYEGLGSIYWHMVSKLMLAVEENCLDALEKDIDPDIRNKLIESYYDIREGLGFNKTPDNYGAFPTDPYSHTPGNAGAQQPGMTGQVKEDIIARFGELGVIIRNGKIIFNPQLLKTSEFITEKSNFQFTDISGNNQTISMDPNSIAFTYCQVPVIYTIGEPEKMIVTFQNGDSIEQEVLTIEQEWSKTIFNRTDKISKITVNFDGDKQRFL